MAEFRATRIMEIDLAEPVPFVASLDETSGSAYGTALVLVRLFTEPLGIVRIPLEEPGAAPEAVARAIRDELRPHLVERLGELDDEALTRLMEQGAKPRSDTYADRRAVTVRDAPHATVILCTRDRAASLRRTLNALANLHYPSYDVLVVDNAPATDAAASVVESMRAAPGLELHRVLEPRPGLSWARNRGFEESKGDILAFIDDDEVPDRFWLAELAAGFRAERHVGCVTGMILPAELRTQAQDWFEQYGGHSKGRTDLRQRLFDTGANRRQHPLYPLPPFGAGGNMAFSRDALERIGAFDPALGAGTPTRGAEDTAAFSDVLIAGYQLVNQPAAFVWHHHYATYEDLKAQLYGYGVGLSSYYVRALRRQPRAMLSLATMVPRALKDYADPGGVRKESIHDLPPDVLHQHLRGMVRGLAAYPASIRRQRRVARSLAVRTAQ